ncbi:hypothetical protein KFK09_018119 [Dendrobium nobile]|uniref:Uncharacterized protein n=1 Tax=Dendrobium nobile TaxID=94219 RepID=A0A8T3AUX7_DENNO|nr:hypothetical protein KFK09_018119 [Dendrobium nobile]
MVVSADKPQLQSSPIPHMAQNILGRAFHFFCWQLTFSYKFKASKTPFPLHQIECLSNAHLFISSKSVKLSADTSSTLPIPCPSTPSTPLKKMEYCYAQSAPSEVNFFRTTP